MDSLWLHYNLTLEKQHDIKSNHQEDCCACVIFQRRVLGFLSLAANAMYRGQLAATISFSTAMSQTLVPVCRHRHKLEDLCFLAQHAVRDDKHRSVKRCTFSNSHNDIPSFSGSETWQHIILYMLLHFSAMYAMLSCRSFQSIAGAFRSLSIPFGISSNRNICMSYSVKS